MKSGVLTLAVKKKILILLNKINNWKKNNKNFIKQHQEIFSWRFFISTYRLRTTGYAICGYTNM